MSAGPDAASIRKATTGLLSQDAAWILTEAFRKHGSVNSGKQEESEGQLTRDAIEAFRANLTDDAFNRNMEGSVFAAGRNRHWSHKCRRNISLADKKPGGGLEKRLAKL